MTHYIDLTGLEDFADPRTASAATIDAQRKLNLMLIAARLAMQLDRDIARREGDRRRERQLDRDLDDTYRTGVMLAAGLKSEGQAVGV